MRIADQLRENVGIALETLRISKLRSALTVLGVVIGIATVMAMATIINGVQDQILTTIATRGTTTIYLFKVFATTPLNADALPAWIRIRPDVHPREAERIAQLPEISYAGMWAVKVGRLEYNGLRLQPNRIYGADRGFAEIIGGELAIGRWFTRQEEASGANVVVVNESYARRLFGRENPMGKVVRVGGRPATIIGLYAPAPNMFDPPGAETAAIIPFRMIDSQFDINRTQEMFIAIKPREGITVERAQEAVTIAMREMRRLRPSQRDNFDMMTQSQMLDLFNKLSGAFFLVMVALSSVGLLVGGIGVMAIMMVSVTSRTREIGVRKALGASRRDILMQFLIEAATLTGIGGVLGILVGLGVGRMAAHFVDVSATFPTLYTAIAVAVSMGIGIVFGMIPARRAARMDPVEALRYE